MSQATRCSVSWEGQNFIHLALLRRTKHEATGLQIIWHCNRLPKILVPRSVRQKCNVWNNTQNSSHSDDKIMKTIDASRFGELSFVYQWTYHWPFTRSPNQRWIGRAHENWRLVLLLYVGRQMHDVSTDGVVALPSSCWDIITPPHEARVSNVTSINGVLVERLERIFITATGDITFNKTEYKYCTLNFIYN